MDVQKDCVLHSRNGQFGNGTSQLSDVTRILNIAQTTAPASGLVLHFHGGLVNEQSGRSIATFLAPKYIAAKAYPVFFVWESGLIETIKNNLNDILADPAFRELSKKVAEWVLKRLGGQVGMKGAPGQAINEQLLRTEFDTWFEGRSPAPPVTDEGSAVPTVGMKGAAGLDEDDLAADIEAGLDGDPDFQDAIQRLYNAHAGITIATRGTGTTAAAQTMLVDERARRDLFPAAGATTKGVLVWFTVAKFVAKVVIAVIKRYAKGRAHGMYCTVVEEVLRAAYMDKAGATIWNQMKKDTADAFGDDDACCGTAFVKELAKLRANGKTFSKITLVGHSTGAVYICQFLDAAAKVLPDLKFSIIFLAPAVRHERFAAALTAHQQRIVGFRMFGMKDAIESEDVLVPILYTRSLLYFVSGLLEGHVAGTAWEDDVDAPVVGMQRYIADIATYDTGDFPDVKNVRQFLASSANTTVWSESSGGSGLNSQSHKHGDFDNDDETVKSLCWIIEQGF